MDPNHIFSIYDPVGMLMRDVSIFVFIMFKGWGKCIINPPLVSNVYLNISAMAKKKTRYKFHAFKAHFWIYLPQESPNPKFNNIQ